MRLSTNDASMVSHAKAGCEETDLQRCPLSFTTSEPLVGSPTCLRSSDADQSGCEAMGSGVMRV